MIDEKKLLCAFIYSAYKSGYCGHLLDPKTKENHLELYKDYIKNENYFPEKEINETQKKMMDEVRSTSTREYIYKDHHKVVISRIEDTLGKSIQQISLPTPIKDATGNCITNFYKIESISPDSVKAINIITNKSIELKVLEGLEEPKVGDTVSGHWNHLLEVVNDWEDFPKYLKTTKEYYGQFK